MSLSPKALANRRAYSKRWRLANPERNRAHSLKHGRKHLPAPTRPLPTRCECCGKLPGKRALALDHDHKTGEFRGWLCVKCNVSIGQLGDDLDGVMCAVRYLSADYA